MQRFDPSNVPTIALLAMEFAVFDGYFSSVPGPTEVNRRSAYSATSHGMGTNDAVQMVEGLSQQTMFASWWTWIWTGKCTLETSLPC